MNMPSTPPDSVADILLSEPLVRRYLTTKRYVGLSPITLQGYAWYLEALAREHPILPTDPEALQGFLKSRGGQAPDSLKTCYRTVRIFYNWLVKQEVLAVGRDPATGKRRQQIALIMAIHIQGRLKAVPRKKIKTVT